MTSGASAPAPLALTMGDPAGIGGEITLKAWASRSEGVPPFFLIADPDQIRREADALAPGTPIREILAPDEAAAVFPDALPVMAEPLRRPAVPGGADPENGPAVINAIRRAVAFAQSGAAAAVVTNPINKKVLAASGFPHPGHTEFLGELTATAHPVMMLACPGLRAVPITVHLPLVEAIGALTTEAIVEAGRITAAALRRDFAIDTPRLAVAGLNPHAGESGMLGREDGAVIAPAVAQLICDGIDTFGPAPADSLFHAAARATYDAVLCMYHDQALIPVKTIDFHHGVDVTLGLPILRTSPDHGTAFDIAGRGVARETSLIAALQLARAMATNRARIAGPATVG